jgi:class 3 adenylate cyclase
MAAYITQKNSWIRLSIALFAAGGAALILNLFLSGPRLGPWYDFLLRYRSAPPVSREILLIETGDSGGGAIRDHIIDAPVLTSILLSMIELDASSLIIQAPVLGLSPGGAEGEAEILLRFDGEFALLGRNIRNLFEAIRVGSIPPADSGRYVEDLVDLAERGKERLVDALARRDGEGMIRFERAARAFGRVRQAGDLNLGFIRNSETGKTLPAAPPGYSRIRLDGDGAFRRIAPVIHEGDRARRGRTGRAGEGAGTVHVVYGLFRDHYRDFGIENTPGGAVLRNTAVTGGEEIRVPLDKGGALILESPRGREDFRRIGLAAFSEYDKEDRALRRLLGEAEIRGIYQSLEPENYPSLRYDYALSLREDMLEDPGPAKKTRWVEARKAYFKGLEDFLYSPVETKLVTGYEELIASGEIDGEGVLRLTGLRDELIAAFSALRDQHRRLLAARKNLETALSSALCILGPPNPGPPPPPRLPTDTEASAIFANALLTGRFVIPGTGRFLLLASLGCALFCLLCVRRAGPLPTLLLGLSLAALAAGGFSYGFIRSSRWIDPLAPAGSSAAGVIASALCALAIKRRFVRDFTAAYGPSVSGKRLKHLLRQGFPRPEERIVLKAAVVAVRGSALTGREDREAPPAAAAAVEQFRETAARLIREAGGTVAGTGGDLVLGAFGSPLEEGRWKGRRDKKGREPAEAGNPAARAAQFVREALKRPGLETWRFGIDAGECAFTASALGGYCAFGHPAVRARILAGLASRYKARLLISRSAGESVPGAELRKLDTLGEWDGTGREAFYEMVIG